MMSEVLGFIIGEDILNGVIYINDLVINLSPAVQYLLITLSITLFASVIGLFSAFIKNLCGFSKTLR